MKRGRMIVGAVLMACSFTARAQWIQTAGPEGAVAGGIAVDGRSVIALVDKHLYNFDGTKWSRVGSLDEFDGTRPLTGGLTLLRDGDGLLANTGSGIVSSSNDGRTWTAAGKVGVLFRLGEKASVWADGMVFQPEHGTSWKQVARLPGISTMPVLFRGVLYVTQVYEAGLRRSTDNGERWEEVPTPGASIRSGSLLAAGSNALYAADGRNIYRSDDGTVWHDIGSDLPEWLVIDRIVPAARPMITTNMGLHRFDGTTWEKIGMAAVTAVETTDAGAIIATRAGIFSLMHDSRDVVSLNRGLIGGNAGMLGAIGEIVLSTTPNGIYRSTDRGESWSHVSSMSASGFAQEGDVLYTISGMALRSSDSGATWMPSGPVFGFEWEGPPQRNDVTALAAAEGAVYLGIARFLTDKGANGGWASGGVFRSIDNGATWQEMNSGLPHGAGGVPAPVGSIVATPDHVVISTAAGIYRSTDRGARWVPATSGLPMNNRNSGQGRLSIAGSTLYLQSADGIFESTDGAFSWRALSHPLPDGFQWYSTIASVDDLIYMRGYRDNGAGGFDERLFVLKNVWQDITATQPQGVEIESVLRAGNFLYAGTRRDGVWTMPDEGALPSSVVSTDAPGVRTMSIHPNPALAAATVEYLLSARCNVRLTLINVRGEQIAVIESGMREAGPQTLSIDTRDIPAGLYLLRATAGAETFEGRIVVAK